MLSEYYDSGYVTALEKVSVSMDWVAGKLTSGVQNRASKMNVFDGMKIGFKSALPSGKKNKKFMDATASKVKNISGDTRYLDVNRGTRQDLRKSISILSKELPKK